MTPQQQAEVQWWRSFIDGFASHEAFYRYRVSEYTDKTKYFPDFEKEREFGLEIGCGPVSVFDACSKSMLCIDGLLDEYQQILKLACLRQIYVQADAENLLRTLGGVFNWIVCLNTIDHTAKPEKMVSEIRRVLKPGGRLYFEVNFDDVLGAPHYMLWRKETVQKYLSEFTLQHECLERLDEHRQWRYWAQYVR